MDRWIFYFDFRKRAPGGWAGGWIFLLPPPPLLLLLLLPLLLLLFLLSISFFVQLWIEVGAGSFIVIKSTFLAPEAESEAGVVGVVVVVEENFQALQWLKWMKR